MTATNKLAAEAIGTAWLVIGGCGSVLMMQGMGGAAGGGEEMLSMWWPGLVGISLAFGLTVVTMAYAIGHISGCHLNPAVTVGLTVAGRFDKKDAGPYIAAQIVGGVAGAAILYLVLVTGHEGFKLGDHFADNGYGDRSPGGYTMVAALITEVVMTFFFLFIILGATSKKAPPGFAPIAIGLGLTLIHLISIPVTGTSVNPARSIAAAIFAGSDSLAQCWLFIVGPVVGGGLAGATYGFIEGRDEA